MAHRAGGASPALATLVRCATQGAGAAPWRVPGAPAGALRRHAGTRHGAAGFGRAAAARPPRSADGQLTRPRSRHRAVRSDGGRQDFLVRGDRLLPADKHSPGPRAVHCPPRAFPAGWRALLPRRFRCSGRGAALRSGSACPRLPVLTARAAKGAGAGRTAPARVCIASRCHHAWRQRWCPQAASTRWGCQPCAAHIGTGGGKEPGTGSVTATVDTSRQRSRPARTSKRRADRLRRGAQLVDPVRT
jgi:hypothetical protein